MKPLLSKINLRIYFIVICGLGITACGNSDSAMDMYNASSQEVGLTPAEINWGACPASLGSESKCAAIEGNPKNPGPFTLRLNLPAQTKFAPHWHPGIEHVTVLSGVLHLVSGDDLSAAKAKAYPAGSYLVLPAKMPMMGWVSEHSELQLHGVGPWGMTAIK